MNFESSGWGCSCGARGPNGTTHECPLREMEAIAREAKELAETKTTVDPCEVAALVARAVRAMMAVSR